VLEAVFILLEFPSPSRRVFIGSHSLPPLWFAVSVLHFANMRRAGLKLNPEKCVFGVTEGKILGCLISAKRIEANPDKIRAIREMEEPKTKKDIQKLNGRVAALNRFISKSAERSLPFFKALKGKGTIEWGLEQSKAKAFAELKDYIEKMAIL
jgi:hypothetical protein